MSSTEDELDRHEAAKRAMSMKATLCLVCGNTKLPHALTPGCLSCQGLVRDWDYGRKGPDDVGLGQAQAEMNAVLGEASGRTVQPRPTPIEGRALMDLDHLDRYNLKDWPEIREHWRRDRLAGLNRIPVTGPSVALIGGGLLVSILLPASLEWIGWTAALFGLSYWVAPWWWWK